VLQGIFDPCLFAQLLELWLYINLLYSFHNWEAELLPFVSIFLFIGSAKVCTYLKSNHTQIIQIFFPSFFTSPSAAVQLLKQNNCNCSWYLQIQTA
jgi:hypothetical protein